MCPLLTSLGLARLLLADPSAACIAACNALLLMRCGTACSALLHASPCMASWGPTHAHSPPLPPSSHRSLALDGCYRVFYVPALWRAFFSLCTRLLRVPRSWLTPFGMDMWQVGRWPVWRVGALP